MAQSALALTPLPNNFAVGDGLNTAGYTWQQPAPFPRLQWDFKIDHYFTPSERLSVGYTHENNNNPNANQAQPFPTVPGGTITSYIRVFSLNMLSSLKPNLINEFHGGFHRPNQKYLAPWDPTCLCAPALFSAGGASIGTGFLPKIGGQPFQLGFGQVVSPYGTDNSNTNPIGPYARITPVYQYGDTLSWLKGRHAFKFGGEFWFVSSNGYNSFNVTPRVNSGDGGLGAPLNITSIPGIGANATLAGGMLDDLAGSVNSVIQAFNLTGSPPKFLAGLAKQRTWTTREFNWFAKDDFKITQNLTLSLGVRYEYYGPIYDANGLTATVVGGSAGIFGISGTNYGALFQPGLNQGSLTQMELVGRKSPNASTPLYNPDKNNFAPAVGIAYKLPQIKFLGNRTMVFRAGYGWNYEKITIRHIDSAAGDQDNVRLNNLYQTSNVLNLSNVVLPLTPAYTPLQIDPVTDRTQTAHVMDPNLRNPYVQNWNVGLQAGLTGSTTLQVSYIGSKGTRLMYAADLNEDNIFETGILNAFRATQTGGNSPLLNQLFQGLNVPGVGVVDGVNITGSAAVRQNTTMNTFLANNDVGGFANFLNTSNFLTNQVGGIPRRAGLPENWITVNPQFVSAIYTSNFGSSVYSSMVVQIDKRFSKGVNVSGNYTLSRARGVTEGNSTAEEIDNFLTLRNRSLNERLLSFSIKHAMRAIGTWELPVGPSRALLGSSHGLFGKLVEHWQTGFVFTWNSGTPLGITASGDSYNQFGLATPQALAAVPGNMGSVARVGNGVTYFRGYTLVPDPQVQGFSSAFSARSTLRAVANPAGQIILANPILGTLGNLDQRPIYGPGLFELDMNLMKTFKIKERYSFTVRADATSITNTAQFGAPNLNINSLNFGNITSAGGNRIVTLEARISF